MIVQIFNDQKKFSKGYFEMLSKNNFDLSENILFHYGKKDNYFKEKFNIKTFFISSYFSLFNNVRLLKYLFKANKIIIHSLASPFLLIYLALFKSIANKCVWIVWGKDLYFYYMLKKPKIHHKIYEYIRKKSFVNIRTIVTIIKEDYEVLKSWYTVQGENIECNLLYPFALDNKLEIPEKRNAPYTILIGNSGSSTNRHIELFEKLCKQNYNIIRIYCPLSYGGSKKYIKNVIQKGKELFSEKFLPITKFMAINDYLKILKSVDIGLFNFKRQEGLGNIWTLMFKGKTVYLNSDTTTSMFFDRNNIKYNKLDDLENTDIFSFTSEILINNQYNLQNIINESKSVAMWRIILNY